MTTSMKLDGIMVAKSLGSIGGRESGPTGSIVLVALEPNPLHTVGNPDHECTERGAKLIALILQQTVE